MKVWYYATHTPHQSFWERDPDRDVEHVYEWRADTDREPTDNRPSSSGSWTSTERLTDGQLLEWFGTTRFGNLELLAGRFVKIHRAHVQGPLDTLYVVEDYSRAADGDDEEHRWMGIKRANWGGRCSMTGSVILRSQEFHSIPEGDADQISQILAAAEGGYDERFKRIAVAHEPDGMVVVWSPRNADDDQESDWLRMPRARLVELLRGWLRPEEISQ